MLSAQERATMVSGPEDKEIQQGSRTRYLLYRCNKCGRLITAIQMEAAWARAEEKNLGLPVNKQQHPEVCVCGSRMCNPSNASLREEIASPAIWNLWAQRIAWPWIRDHGLHTFITKR